jgi:hypothetical protein
MGQTDLADATPKRTMQVNSQRTTSRVMIVKGQDNMLPSQYASCFVIISTALQAGCGRNCHRTTARENFPARNKLPKQRSQQNTKNAAEIELKHACDTIHKMSLGVEVE